MQPSKYSPCTRSCSSDPFDIYSLFVAAFNIAAILAFVDQFANLNSPIREFSRLLQAYLDDLPLWGTIGEIDEASKSYYLYTHRRLVIGYNGNRIVDVNLTNEGKVKLERGAQIPFTYEVNWKQSSVPFHLRFDKYLDPSFFQHRIHWFSIFNSFMMVIFLVGLVSMILMRTLRKDYARYSKEEDMDDLERDLGDEYGWKQVHGDVFRSPTKATLFSSLVGCGYQLAVVTICVIAMAIFGDLYTERSSLLGAAIFVYAATSPVNGYFGGSLYSRFGGKRWIRQMLISSFFFPSLVCGVAFLMNFIAIYYHASRAIPFLTMLAVAAICLFIILPLNLVGTILGRNLAGQADSPCRVNAVPRPIPEKKWYMEPYVIALLGGILPFGSIFIEMYFIFTSFWAYKIYYVYGFMLLVYIILAIVTICVTIVCTYFLLVRIQLQKKNFKRLDLRWFSRLQCFCFTYEETYKLGSIPLRRMVVVKQLWHSVCRKASRRFEKHESILHCVGRSARLGRLVSEVRVHFSIRAEGYFKVVILKSFSKHFQGEYRSSLLTFYANVQGRVVCDVISWSFLSTKNLGRSSSPFECARS